MTPKMTPKSPNLGPQTGPQNGPKMSSKSSWGSLGLSWAYLGSQVGPRAPRQPQDSPKMAQDGPKTAPRRPKMAQDGPKTASPKTVQDCTHKTSSLSPLCPKRPLKILQTELVLKNVGERPPVRRRRSRFGCSLALAWAPCQDSFV